MLIRFAPLALMLLTGCASRLTPVDAPSNGVSALGENVGVIQGAKGTDVCTFAMQGQHKTYDVGPGKAFLEPGSVPLDSLVAGDVVNIYARATPYKTKIGLRAQGTSAAPVVINGVSDAACNKPVLDFSGANTAAGSGAVFDSANPQYGESLGGLVIKRGNGDPYGSYEPQFIVIQGMQMQGARSGASYVSLKGKSIAYGPFTACIWVQHGRSLVIRNNIITDCGVGVFTMAKDQQLSEATVRIDIANNRIYGNGVEGSYSEHDLYIQAANPIVEGNFMGPNRLGSEGSTYKSRSSGEVFRRNYVICTARCLDFVQSEDQSTGIMKQPDYGTDYVYANTIMSNGPEAIHYGGDNMGEQNSNGVTGTVFIAPVPYRRHLRFWDNTFTLTTGNYKCKIFALSTKDTEVDAWDNKFVFNFTGQELSWLSFAGILRLGPGNFIEGAKVSLNGQVGSTPDIYSVTTDNSVPADPQLQTLN